jgi:nitrate reductase alpha subunit
MMAVPHGWLPFFLQFDGKNPPDVAREALDAVCTTREEVANWVAQRFANGDLDFALRDVDAPANHPKVLWMYRGNLIGTSMRGHEYGLKHLLGTHNNVLGEDRAQDMVDQIAWHDEAPLGKIDLVYNVNLRMDSSANYSDIVLPTAHWYEKYDLTCTDLHSFFHPFTPAHDPPWETKHDWDAFKLIAERISELAKDHLPTPVQDLVMTALNTDTPDEMAQPMGTPKDWAAGETEPVPGKTFPNVSLVERDYTRIGEKYASLGPALERPGGYGAKGIKADMSDVVQQLKESYLVGQKDGRVSMEDARQVAEIILRISPESDGEVSYKLFEGLEKRTGLPLTQLAEHEREIHHHYPDLVSQPRRSITSRSSWPFSQTNVTTSRRRSSERSSVSTEPITRFLRVGSNP